MIDARVRRLQQRMGPGVSQEVIEALVAAGLDLRSKIKAADDKDLEAIKGIGTATKDKIRVGCPKNR